MTDTILTVTAPSAASGSAKTWADQLAMIARELVGEARAADETAYLEWANELLAYVSEDAKPVTKTYTSADMSLVAGQVILPQGMIGPVIAVRWDSHPIYPKSQAELDRTDPEWQDADPVDTPDWYIINGRILRFAGPVSSIALLEIEAHTQLLSRFPATDPGDINPVSYFPESCMYLPAYYVLASLPYDPGKSQELARFQRNAARVKEMLPRVSEQIRALGSTAFWMGA